MSTLNKPHVAVGARIRALRVARRLSIYAVGERAGINPSNLAKLERGDTQTDLERYARIAGALGVELRSLFPRSRRAA